MPSCSSDSSSGTKFEGAGRNTFAPPLLSEIPESTCSRSVPASKRPRCPRTRHVFGHERARPDHREDSPPLTANHASVSGMRSRAARSCNFRQAPAKRKGTRSPVLPDTEIVSLFPSSAPVTTDVERERFFPPRRVQTTYRGLSAGARETVRAFTRMGRPA